MVTTTRLAPRRLPSISACPSIRAPLIPYGWPIAIAPPSTFSRSAGQAQPVAAIQHLARERLVQLPKIDVVHRRARAAPAAAAPHRPGRSPSRPARTRPRPGRGTRPSAARRAAPPRGPTSPRRPLAPSLNWLALPAVMNWSSPRTGFSLASPSSGRLGPVALVLAQGDLLASDLVALLVAQRLGRSAAARSPASNRPACCPAAVRRWLSSAYSSCASRLIP